MVHILPVACQATAGNEGRQLIFSGIINYDEINAAAKFTSLLPRIGRMFVQSGPSAAPRDLSAATVSSNKHNKLSY